MYLFYMYTQLTSFDQFIDIIDIGLISIIDTTHISDADVPSRSALREAMKENFVKLGERVFYVAAPQTWNRLPTDLKTLRFTTAFNRSLKIFLFRTAYNV